MRTWNVIGGLLLMATLGTSGDAAGAPAPSGVLDFSVRTAAGGTQALGEYRGRVLLLVNTASRCGFTPQYESLEKLYQRYEERGLTVLGFPANDFLGQEPGTDAEIQSFCRLNYGVTFPVFAKIHVKGKGIDPLYAWLTKRSPFPGNISWNFNKFLVAPDGRVVARWGSRTDPLDDEVTSAIEALLPAK